MSMPKIRQLAPQYASEIDTVDEPTWCRLLPQFDDANIYQAWSYAAVISGSRNMSHLILKRQGEVVAIAQARIAKLPFINLGIAYIQWGPLWRRGGAAVDVEIFAQAIRGLRNEFVCKRGLSLRLFPLAFADESSPLSSILTEEGFSSLRQDRRGRTILMDLRPSLEDLRQGMRPHWRRELKVAEKRGLEVIEDSNDESFESFIGIYKEMVGRKKFVEPNDIHQFRAIQARLPEQFKMKIMLCRTAEGACSGLICSAIGRTAVYLFGATSNAGMKSRGSYLLQWRLIEQLKRDGILVYDLNGINPAKNAGTYKFKDDLAGRNGKDVCSLGRFDSHSGFLGRVCIEGGDMLRSSHRSMRQLLRSARAEKLRRSHTSQNSGAVASDAGIRSTRVPTAPPVIENRTAR
jgi:hypothetical protein